MLRRLHHDQPESFAFTEANLKWAEAQIAKYPEGRQASAVIPLLWRAQEQEGWVSRPIIETVAKMLGMAEIRVLEVATFYFMFQMKPVGSVAHFQICGTTSCMICGAEDLVAVCKEKIAPTPHTLSADGKFSWEEVECLGACANAPMAQIGKDYYEDLSAESFSALLEEFAAGKVPAPGSRKGRFASEPVTGLTSLKFPDEPANDLNASKELAKRLGDTVARITGEPKDAAAKAAVAPVEEKSAGGDTPGGAEAEDEGIRPASEEAPKEGGSDDLKKIKGIGPALEEKLHKSGIWRYEQIANWSDEEVAWVDANLTDFKGRVSRDDWIAQAAKLAAGRAAPGGEGDK